MALSDPLAITLTLEKDTSRFRPGEEVCGRVLLVGPSSGWTADFADVILFWRTEGRGDRDEGVAGVLNLVRTRGEAMPPSVERDFRFPLPDLPFSYHGKLIKIHWYVGVYGQGRGERRLEGMFELPLVVHPRPDSFPGAR